MKTILTKLLYSIIFTISVLSIAFGSFTNVYAGANDKLTITNQVDSVSSILLQGGTTVTYKVKIANTGIVDSEPLQFVNIFQVSNIKQGNSAGGVIRIQNPQISIMANPFIPFSNTVKVFDTIGPGSIVDAYPTNGDLTNTSRVINFGSIRSGDYVEFNVKVDISGTTPNFCDLTGNGPAMRNITMLANPGFISNGSTVSSNDALNLSLTNNSPQNISNLIQFNGNTVNIAPGVLYIDQDTNNNLSSTDSTYTRFCQTDVRTTISGDVGLGQLTASTDAITYTLKVKNIGNIPANSTATKFYIPICSTFDGFISGLNGTVSGKQIDFNVGDLALDQEVTSIFKVKPDFTGACQFSNSIVLQASANSTVSSQQFDSNIANNSALFNSTPIILNLSANLTLTTTQLIAAPGDKITYNLKLNPSGTNYNGKIVLELPAGTTFSSISSVNGSYTLSVVGNTVTYNIADQPGANILNSDIVVEIDANTTGILIARATATSVNNQVNFAQAITSLTTDPSSSIRGFVFFDANKNSSNDAGERNDPYSSSLNGIEVIAVAANAKQYKASTDQTGAFAINKIPAGKYSVYVNINSLPKSYNNLVVNVAATSPTNDGLIKIADVRPNETFDITAAFRLFTGNALPAAQPIVSGGTTLILSQDQKTQNNTLPPQSATNTTQVASTTLTNQSSNTTTNTTNNSQNPNSSSNNSNTTTSNISNNNGAQNGVSNSEQSSTSKPSVLGVEDKNKSSFDSVAGSLIRTGAYQNSALIALVAAIICISALGVVFYLNNKS